MNTKKHLSRLTRTVCTKTTDECFDYLRDHYRFDVIGTAKGMDRFAIRRGSLPIVGVCHLDTVLANPRLEISADGYYRSSELDDRLGLAGLLLLAKTYDFTIVATDNEEIGQTTGDAAAWHILESMDTPYEIGCNWLFELDRRGTDVVTYGYSCPLWEGILLNYFKRIGHGSFSDISAMECIERKAVNIGIGYHREHTPECHARIDIVLDQLERTSRMIQELSNVPMIHDPMVNRRTYRKNAYRSWDDSWSSNDPFGYVSSPEQPVIDMTECGYCGHRFDSNEPDSGYLGDYELCGSCVRKLSEDGTIFGG